MASRTAKKDQVFTAEEKAAMKEAVREAKAAKEGADQEAQLLEKIAELDGLDRELAERIHAIVGEVAPGLNPRTYYGMPAWAKDGKVVVFFQPASKFKARYGTLGFQDTAQLDDGAMWPTSYAVTKLTKAVEKQIAELVRAAAG